MYPKLNDFAHRRICTKFGTAVGAADVITCTKFFGDRSRRVYYVGGSKIAISHWQSQSPLTQGWRYRAARDKQKKLHDN